MRQNGTPHRKTQHLEKRRFPAGRNGHKDIKIKLQKVVEHSQLRYRAMTVSLLLLYVIPSYSCRLQRYIFIHGGKLLYIH